MARIQIRKMKDPFSPPTHPPVQENPLARRTPNIRINPPSQASLFRKTVPGSVLNPEVSNALPQVQVFFSAKGGSGTSFLAAAYAGAAAALTGMRVLLMDMDHNNGGIEAYTGIEPNRSILHLKPVMDELNELHIRSVVQTERSTAIDILASPADPELAAMIEPWEIAALMQQVKNMYDLIIIDTGSELAQLNLPLFETADRIHYVMLPDSPSLRRYKLAENWLLSKGISPQKLAILLNRAGKANEIQLRDLRQIPGLNIEGIIHSDFAAIQSNINLAQPLMKRFHDRRQPIILRDILKLIKAQTGKGVL